MFPKRQFNCCIIQHSTASCSAQLNAMATANANVTAAQTASQPQTATSAPDPANSSNSKATTASSNSILQNRLSQCSQPKSYTAPGPHSPAGVASSNNHGQPPQERKLLDDLCDLLRGVHARLPLKTVMELTQTAGKSEDRENSLDGLG